MINNTTMRKLYKPTKTLIAMLGDYSVWEYGGDIVLAWCYNEELDSWAQGEYYLYLNDTQKQKAINDAVARMVKKAS